jgi:hypothetical protein
MDGWVLDDIAGDAHNEIFQILRQVRRQVVLFPFTFLANAVDRVNKLTCIPGEQFAPIAVDFDSLSNGMIIDRIVEKRNGTNVLGGDQILRLLMLLQFPVE